MTTTHSWHCRRGSAAQSSATRSTLPSRTVSTGLAPRWWRSSSRSGRGTVIHFASAFALMARTLGMREPHRGGLPSWQRYQRCGRTRNRLLGLQRSAARVAGGAFRGNRLGSLRADERTRSCDLVLAQQGPFRESRTTPPRPLRRRVHLRPSARPVARGARRRSEWRRSWSHLHRGQPAACAHPDPRHPARPHDSRPHPGAEASADAHCCPQR